MEQCIRYEPTENCNKTRNDKIHWPSIHWMLLQLSRLLSWTGWLAGWLTSRVEITLHFAWIYCWGAKRAKCLLVSDEVHVLGCKGKERRSVSSCLESNYRGSSDGLTANVVNTACGFAGCGSGGGIVGDILQDSFGQVRVVEGRLKTKVWGVWMKRRRRWCKINKRVLEGVKISGFKISFDGCCW